MGSILGKWGIVIVKYMRKENKNLNIYIHMGLNESTIKLITEPINHMIDNCGHSDFKSKCCVCLEIEIDTTHCIHSTPVILSLPSLPTLSRENSNHSIASITSASKTTIAGKQNQHDL